MAGQLIEKKRIQGIAPLAEALFADFKAIGLTQVLPAVGGSLNLSINSFKGDFIFESTPEVNPVHETQPWRILVNIECDSDGIQGNLRVSIGNPQQIDPSFTPLYSTFPGALDSNGTRVMGQLGSAWKQSSVAPGTVFFARKRQSYLIDEGTVYSYTLLSTGHGIALFLWEDAGDDAPAFSWFVVQSPVDKETGAPLVTDNSPIFCVYCCDNHSINRFVVSETDIYRPTISKPADKNDVNSNAIINAEEQIAIAKGNKYLVNFLNGINTDRYAYTEELDLLGYTSADVIAENTEIPVTAYGEAEPRIYRAMKANGPNNTKMRIMMLVQGGDGPAAPVTPENPVTP